MIDRKLTAKVPFFDEDNLLSMNIDDWEDLLYIVRVMTDKQYDTDTQAQIMREIYAEGSCDATGRHKDLIAEAKTRRAEDAYPKTYHMTKGTDCIVQMSKATSSKDSNYWYISVPNAGKMQRMRRPGIAPLTGLPVTASLLFLWVVGEYTANRYVKTTKPGSDVGNYEISLSVDEWARKRQLPYATDNQKKKAQESLREAIRCFYGAEVVYLDGRRRYIFIGRGRMQNGYFPVVLSAEVAEDLRTAATITRLSEKLFIIDARNPTAFIMAYKFNLHYFMDNNIRKGTRGTLTVKSLYDFASLPTKKQLSEGNLSWKHRAKAPFDSALSYLESIDFITDVRYDPSEAQTFADWLKVKIYFTMPGAPDQTTRLEAKDAKIKEDLEKKKKEKAKTPKEESEEE